MQEYKLSKRIKNGDRIVSYILTDRSGGHIEVDPDSLKRAIKAGEVKVKGLRLTYDYRLIIISDEFKTYPPFLMISSLKISIPKVLFQCVITLT